MKIKSNQLITDLIELTNNNLDFVIRIRKNNLEELNWSRDESSWSTLQCIEHLNLYGEFYLPEIEESIVKGKRVTEEYFKSGFLGNRFAESMLPGDKMKKMKTFKSKTPTSEALLKIYFKTSSHSNKSYWNCCNLLEK